MNFKLDENIDIRAAAVLEHAGHNVATVEGQHLTGANDTVIAETVKAEARILVTFDRGFGDLRAYPPGTHPGIVVLRLRNQARTAVTEALQFLLSYDDLPGIAGCIVNIDVNTIRLRRP